MSSSSVWALSSIIQWVNRNISMSRGSPINLSFNHVIDVQTAIAYTMSFYSSKINILWYFTTTNLLLLKFSESLNFLFERSNISSLHALITKNCKSLLSKRTYLIKVHSSGSLRLTKAVSNFCSFFYWMEFVVLQSLIGRILFGFFGMLWSDVIISELSPRGLSTLNLWTGEFFRPDRLV